MAKCRIGTAKFFTLLLLLYRISVKAEGKKSFFLDSKAPTGDFEAFLRGEVRYASLEHEFPDVAKELFKKTKEDAMARRALYERLDAE